MIWNAVNKIIVQDRHCEEQSNEAIHTFFAAWIASLRSQ
jgi:hypothetical protein